MNSTIRRIAVIAAVVAGAGLILFTGSTVLARGGGPSGWSNMMGGGGYNRPTARTGSATGNTQAGSYGWSNMMGGHCCDYWGMGWTGYTGTLPYGRGAMMRGGMMGYGYGYSYGYGADVRPTAQPLSVGQATDAVNGYLAGLGNPDLIPANVMVFDNNAYARVNEKSTGVGAFELLVDPMTRAVTPEPGPNMMWNTKYGPMSGAWGAPPAAMSVSAPVALKAAQSYLDQYVPGAQVAADEVATFYGYYTIDFTRDGQVAGMLSVNGYSGQVFLHTWHGTFIAESSQGGR